MNNDECRYSRSRFHLVILTAPLGRPLSDFTITEYQYHLYRREVGDSRKSLDFSLFRILLHCHSLALSLCIRFWILCRLYHQLLSCGQITLDLRVDSLLDVDPPVSRWCVDVDSPILGRNL